MEKQYVACRKGFRNFAVQGEDFQIIIAIGIRCGDSRAAFCVFLASFGTFGIDVVLCDGDGESGIRGFAGVRDPIVAEVPGIIMLHRNVDQHVCKAKREAHHTILIFLEIDGNTEQHHTIRGIALVLSVYVRQPSRYILLYRDRSRFDRDGDVSGALGPYSR